MFRSLHFASKSLLACMALADLMGKAARIKAQAEQRFRHKKESAVTMKKSGIIVVIAALAAAAGALAAAFLYLRRREKELDEYEKLLFSEDFSDEDAEEGAENAEAAPDKAEPDETSAE